MTKKEILNLINANRIINKNELRLPITKNKTFRNRSLNKELWFPAVEELKEEFGPLYEQYLEEYNQEENRGRGR